MATDHFDDVKELVIRRLLNRMESRIYGTEAQAVDNFLFEHHGLKLSQKE